MTKSPVVDRIIEGFVLAMTGAVVAMLLSSSGQRKQVEQDQQQIQALQQDVKELQQNYATNKRVDDLQVEMRANYRDVSVKLDNVVQLLLEQRRR
jgi:hypothetical protein